MRNSLRPRAIASSRLVRPLESVPLHALDRVGGGQWWGGERPVYQFTDEQLQRRRTCMREAAGYSFFRDDWNVTRGMRERACERQFLESGRVGTRRETPTE